MAPSQPLRVPAATTGTRHAVLRLAPHVARGEMPVEEGGRLWCYTSGGRPKEEALLVATSKEPFQRGPEPISPSYSPRVGSPSPKPPFGAGWKGLGGRRAFCGPSPRARASPWPPKTRIQSVPVPSNVLESAPTSRPEITTVCGRKPCVILLSTNTTIPTEAWHYTAGGSCGAEGTPQKLGSYKGGQQKGQSIPCLLSTHSSLFLLLINTNSLHSASAVSCP